MTVAGSVIELLKEEKRWQEQKRELAGSAWDNSWNLVFTNELGRHLCHVTVYKHFKETVKKIGLPEERSTIFGTRMSSTRQKNIICKSRNPKLPFQMIVWDFCSLGNIFLCRFTVSRLA